MLASSVHLYGPVWILYALNWVVYIGLVVGGAGLLVLFLPFFRRAWMLEIGLLALVVGFASEWLGVAVAVGLLFPPLGALIALPLVIWVAWWLPLSHRTYTVVAEAVIPATPEDVFALITDVSRYSVLNPMVVEAAVEGGGPVQLGSRIHSRVKVGYQRFKGTDLVTEFDPPRAFGDRSLGRTANSWRVTLQPVMAGTLIRSEYRGSLSVVNALVAGHRKGRVVRTSFEMRQRWLGAIAREMEQRPKAAT